MDTIGSITMMAAFPPNLGIPEIDGIFFRNVSADYSVSRASYVSAILPRRIAARLHEATGYGIAPKQRILDWQLRAFLSGH